MIPGNIIVLNGTSSSGKTSILRALQQVLDAPYLDAGIDKFLWMLPKRYLNVPLWHEVFSYTYAPKGESADLVIRAGPLGFRLMSGMHRAIQALACAGNNVLADHVLLEPVWVRECAELFADLPAWFVGIRCPLDVLEARERARSDRTVGQARAQFDAVHAHSVYDMEVDTSALSPMDCAMRIRRQVMEGPVPDAFKRLRALARA
jgi:chloramphenicol 3-O phosphotransferase